MAAPRPDSVKSVAVLPFVDHSRGEGNEYFSEGISEEITNALSQVPGLRVVARTSAFAFKGSGLSAGDVARQLDVNAVLVGTVERTGDRVRVTARLYDADRGSPIWSEHYEIGQAEVFSVQRKITAAVARSLGIQVRVGEEKRLSRPSTAEPEAYDLYLKGRFVMEHRGDRNLRKALEYFERAVEADPGFAPAHTGVADALCLRALYGFARPRDVMPAARAAAERAVELDEELAESHAALGFVLWSYAWEWDGVEREYRRAIELNPNNVTVLAYYGFYYLICVRDREEEGIDLIEQAVEIDPLATMPVAMLGVAHYYTGRGRDVLERVREGVEGHPSFWLVHRALGLVLAGLGRYDEALEEMEKAAKLSGRNPWTVTELGFTRAMAGDREGALERHRELLDESTRRYVQPFLLAAVPSVLGEIDEAMAWLQKSHEERDGILVVVRRFPPFAPLRNDPRFAAILRGMGL